MATPITKCNPIWLATRDPEDPTLNKHYRRSVIYYRQLHKAWPDWCANDLEFWTIYYWAKCLRACGLRVQVDHIVPIKSPIVSGLHVPWNLQVIHEDLNYAKSNTYWPGHPCENRDLFDD